MKASMKLLVIAACLGASIAANAAPVRTIDIVAPATDKDMVRKVEMQAQYNCSFDSKNSGAFVRNITIADMDNELYKHRDELAKHPRSVFCMHTRALVPFTVDENQQFINGVLADTDIQAVSIFHQATISYGQVGYDKANDQLTFENFNHTSALDISGSNTITDALGASHGRTGMIRLSHSDGLKNGILMVPTSK